MKKSFMGHSVPSRHTSAPGITGFRKKSFASRVGPTWAFGGSLPIHESMMSHEKPWLILHHVKFGDWIIGPT
jgi:hypothetical protein